MVLYSLRRVKGIGVGKIEEVKNEITERSRSGNRKPQTSNLPFWFYYPRDGSHGMVSNSYETPVPNEL